MLARLSSLNWATQVVAIHAVFTALILLTINLLHATAKQPQALTVNPATRQQCQQLQQKLAREPAITAVINPTQANTIIMPKLQQLAIANFELEHKTASNEQKAREIELSGACDWRTITQLINIVTQYRMPWQLKNLSIQQSSNALHFDISLQEDLHD